MKFAMNNFGFKILFCRIPSLENLIKGIIKKNLSLVALVPGKDDIVGLLIIDEKVKF